MKKLMLAAVAAFALTAPSAFADTSVGVVNVAKIMQESKAATSVRSQLQTKEKSFQAEFDQKQKDLHAEDMALVKEKDKVDKDAFGKKVKAFQDKAVQVQQQVQQKKGALDKALGASLEEIQKTVLEIVKQVAAEKKMNLVVSSAQVLYSDQTFDITDEVLKRLDAKLPTVAVKF